MFTHRSGNFFGSKALVLVVLAFGCLASAQSQSDPQSSSVPAASSSVPHVVNFDGALAGSSGKPYATTVGVTFLLYKDQTGGAPLWLETQNVRPDHAGRYTVTLGSTTALPSDIFTSGEARWLAVQPEGQNEQPRVLLVAVPYALKAADAETIGGLPPSAFVLATPVATNPAPASSAGASSTPTSPVVANTVDGTGATGFIPIWTGPSTLDVSALFQSGSGTGAKLGIGTPTPLATLDVKGGAFIRGAFSLPASAQATSTAGKNSQSLNLIASAFNSGTSTAVNQNFRWQTEPVGNNTAAPSGSLNLLFGQGSVAPVETGFQIASNGLLTFAPGQTFPGTGTITGVTAGTALTGGGTSGNITLNLDTAKLPQLNGGNSFRGDQNVTGNLTATGRFTSETGVFTGGVFISLNSEFSTPVVSIRNDSVDGPFLRTLSGPDENEVLLVGPTSLSFNATTAGTHDPIAQFGSTGASDQNAIKTYNGTGNAELFIAGKANGFVPGTAAGDGGLRVNKAQKIFFGDSSLARMSIDGNGNVKITGNLSKGGGSFKIDHPLDPRNKYLYHSFVESPDMKNVYDGTVTTDKHGMAIVTMPEYFEALNRDFRYQLTVIGQFAQAIVAQEISHNRFAIKTNKPNVKVSWQVTGIRQDAYANAHRIPTEEEKPETERGSYLHPEAFPAPFEIDKATVAKISKQ